jgi:reactive intermediate/imine deaminase
MLSTALGLLLALGISGCLAVATVDGPPPSRVTYYTDGTIFPGTVPFSEAVRVGNTLYLSGMIGVLPGTMTLVEGGLEAETRQTMDNIKATVEAHGYTMRDLVKCTAMLEDISRWGDFNAIYRTYFSDRFPARSALGTNGLALGAQVEVECIAAKG